jgi:hypothetical protein
MKRLYRIRRSVSDSGTSFERLKRGSERHKAMGFVVRSTLVL